MSSKYATDPLLAEYLRRSIEREFNVSLSVGVSVRPERHERLLMVGASVPLSREETNHRDILDKLFAEVRCGDPREHAKATLRRTQFKDTEDLWNYERTVT